MIRLVDRVKSTGNYVAHCCSDRNPCGLSTSWSNVTPTHTSIMLLMSFSGGSWGITGDKNLRICKKSEPIIYSRHSEPSMWSTSQNAKARKPRHQTTTRKTHHHHNGSNLPRGNKKSNEIDG